jgi:aspartate kinase
MRSSCLQRHLVGSSHVLQRFLHTRSATVSRTLPRARAALAGIKTQINYAELPEDPDVAKISVVGVGMRSHAGVANTMFSALADKAINIQVISTSEIKVSVLIAAEYTEFAVRALHTAYGLDA